jgi:uncharacterized protein (TIGR03435 family)
MPHLRAVLLSLLVFLPVAAQETLPQFEVAIVKPIDLTTSLRMVGAKIYPEARVAITSVPLKGLIAIASQLSFWQIPGGEPWIEKDQYDIEAKPFEPRDRRRTSAGAAAGAPD